MDYFRKYNSLIHTLENKTFCTHALDIKKL